jgi:hypothetical protein
LLAAPREDDERPSEQHADTTETAAVDARSEKDEEEPSLGAEFGMARDELEDDKDVDGAGEPEPELDLDPGGTVAPLAKMCRWPWVDVFDEALPPRADDAMAKRNRSGRAPCVHLLGIP